MIMLTCVPNEAFRESCYYGGLRVYIVDFKLQLKKHWTKGGLVPGIDRVVTGGQNEAERVEATDN